PDDPRALDDHGCDADGPCARSRTEDPFARCAQSGDQPRNDPRDHDSSGALRGMAGWSKRPPYRTRGLRRNRRQEKLAVADPSGSSILAFTNIKLEKSDAPWWNFSPDSNIHVDMVPISTAEYSKWF